MKICILGDTHIGARGDSPHFHKLFSQFYSEILFPYLKDNNISTIFQLGDLFDRRKYINFQTLHSAKKYFFNPLSEFEFFTLLGNHDISYKNTLEVNSSQLLLSNYKNIKIYDKPTTLNFDGTDIDVIPWICKENENEILEFISNSKSKYCFGHFELAGYEMDKGNVSFDGMDKDFLSHYDMVLSGHFHHKSSDGRIFYVGTPTELTWADYGDERGFHILDTKTGEMEFIQNPHRMFYKIIFDGKNENIESVTNRDFSAYSDKIVKVIVENKDNDYLFELFFDCLYKVMPLDISIIENAVDYNQLSDNDMIDQAEDTITILNKYIDSINSDIDAMRLKNLIHEIYVEAQSE
jgi:DNA repair exonuclease SbcCD nuclease subunit